MDRLVAVLGTAALGACAPSAADQLMIHVVDGTPRGLAVPEDLDAFEVHVATVREGQEDLTRVRRVVPLASTAGPSLEGAVRLPQSLAIARAGQESTGRVRIIVLGLRGGRALQRIERLASFGLGRVDLPPFVLSPLCFGVTCPVGETCRAEDGACEPITGPPDAGVPVDAGRCGPGVLDCGGECIPSDDENCGACGRPCEAGRRCISGVCACGPGLASCGGVCTDLTTDAANCGACDTACSAPSARVACSGGACAIVGCDAGRANCDGQVANGCEVQLGTRLHCSRCGDTCDVPRGSATCFSGVCAITGCDGGFEDCDREYATGCETRLGTDSDCSRCGERCSLPNAASSCSGGRCAISSCHGGFESCDGDDRNGCETRLGTDSDCTGCGHACDVGETCAGGACACRNDGHWSDERGPCLPSCGVLLDRSASAGMGGSCCPTGCLTFPVGGRYASYDCAWCCVGDDTCL